MFKNLILKISLLILLRRKLEKFNFEAAIDFLFAKYICSRFFFFLAFTYIHHIQTYNKIQNNYFTAFLLLDLKKAFDTVSHDILLNKLEHYGICGVAKNLFLSFLENRQQLVTINYYESSKLSINFGVPQGSVLDPLLFLLYINDLPNCTASSLKLFADDTCLILADPPVQNFKTKISEELQKIANWVNANKLTLNLTKSNIIIVPPNLTLINCQIFTTLLMNYKFLLLMNLSTWE